MFISWVCRDQCISVACRRATQSIENQNHCLHECSPIMKPDLENTMLQVVRTRNLFYISKRNRSDYVSTCREERNKSCGDYQIFLWLWVFCVNILFPLYALSTFPSMLIIITIIHQISIFLERTSHVLRASLQEEAPLTKAHIDVLRCLVASSPSGKSDRQIFTRAVSNTCKIRGGVCMSVRDMQILTTVRFRRLMKS